MLEVEKISHGFHTRMVWLSDGPFDQEGVDAITFVACRNKVDAEGFRREEGATIVIDLAKGIDEVWNNMSSKCRTGVRKAEKDGIIVQRNKDLKAFMDLNDDLRSNKGLAPSGYSMDMLMQLSDPLPEYSQLFTARLNDDVLAGVMYLMDENRMYGLIGASKRLDVTSDMKSPISNANRLIWWEAIRFAAEKGMREMDMGGYYAGKDPNPQLEGVNEFKRRFGGQVVNDYSYVKYYSARMKMARTVARPIRKVQKMLSPYSY